MTQDHLCLRKPVDFVVFEVHNQLAGEENCIVAAIAEDAKSQSGRHSTESQLKAFSHLVLRCVVFQSKPGEYTAECIDLDMLTKAATAHDALRGLKQAMQGYLCVALDGDLNGLVPRPSPLGHRARYHLFALRAAFGLTLNRNFLVSDWSPGPSPCC